MADTVQYLMEEMIPELEDLESKGYFSRSEVKQIAQKRQDFEYHLKRRAALKRDFLRYIDYECKLEELRKYRKKAKGIKGVKKGLAEMGIVRRVHFIYERATRKFKADLSLWMAWLDYCKRTKSTKQFSKVVTKALHRHSHVPALWVEAAVWEFERTGNVAAARALMQQGLRHCPNDEALWAEYLRLELLYVVRLRARRAVLGLPNPDAPEDFAPPALKVKRKRKPTATTAAAAAPPDSEDAEGGDATAAGSNDAVDGDAAVRSVLTGVVARAVIKGAVAAAPTQLSMRTRILAVLRDFSFPGVPQLTDLVYQGIATDFPTAEDAWDILARRQWSSAQDGRSTAAAVPGASGQQFQHLPPAFAFPAADQQAEEHTDMHADGSSTWEVDPAQHEACCKVYEEGIKALPSSAAMWDLYVRYLGQRCLPVWHAAQQGQEAAIHSLAAVGAQLLSQYQAALDRKCASEATCSGYVDWAMALNQPKFAVRAARAACDLHPTSAAVWSRRLALELELHARKRSSMEDVLSTLQLALKALPASQTCGIWRLVLNALPPTAPDHAQLQHLLIRYLQGQGKGPVEGGMGSVVGELLQQVNKLKGLVAARKLYKQMMTAPPAGGDMFQAMVNIELQALQSATAGNDRKEAEAAVHRVFESAIDAYGAKDSTLWLRYAQFERSTLKSAGDIYWRATKALDEPDVFIEQYRQQLGVC